jgi:peptidoglycan/xylan/chitin deacetylase (PgdA/CDA1 family)
LLIGTALSWLYPGSVWKVKTTNKSVYLTFDDGPIPEVTPWVLHQLEAYQAQATFFCIGNNVEKNPDVFNLVLKGGHAIGNHTFHHLKGWNVSDDEYLSDINKASQFISSSLFRPPYGKIKLSQARKVSRTHQIIFWDVLSYDFDNTQTPEAIIRRVKKQTRNGSIIVFHDSVKAWPRLQIVLPEILKWLNDEGFALKALPINSQPDV